MTSMRAPLVVIEAPGKARRLAQLLRAAGYAADVWATRGHFRNNPSSLWPLNIDQNLVETARSYDSARLAVLRAAAQSRSVILATDPDQEGDVIARDVHDAVCNIASSVQRVHLHALDVAGVKRAFANVRPYDPVAAVPGDARRIIDRLVGSACSSARKPVGRVFTGALGAMDRTDPIVGHVTLTLPAVEGLPFVARVPVTARTREIWMERLAESRSFSAATVAFQHTELGPAWGYAKLLSVASGAALMPSHIRAGAP